MKLFGHPLHAMLIHFPTALLPMDAVLSWGFFWQGTESLGFAAFYAALGGAATGVIAMVSGILDLLALPKANRAVVGSGLVHGLVNGTVVMIYAALVYKALLQYPVLFPPTITLLVVKTLLILTLFAGNFIGGSLVYKHGVGIQTKNLAQ